MALFTAATVPQQETMLVHMLQMRGLVGEFSRFIDRMASHQVAWASTNSALFTALDVGLLIPDIAGVTPTPAVIKLSGLQGAQPLTREDVISMNGTNFANLLTTFNTAGANALYVKMVGAMNAVQG